MSNSSKITVFTARKIHTMEPALPEATAIAVRDGRILEVGTLETLQPWLDLHDYERDDQFADKVLLPGFIDPHLHPTMAAVLLPMYFITAMEWKLPWETVKPVQSRQAYLSRLKEIEAGMEDPDEPLFAWGYHRNWHGEITRNDLDGISATRPVIAWHRSFHEVIVNSATLKWVGLDAENIGDNPQVDLPNGRFYEMGLRVIVNNFMGYLLAPERYAQGLKRMRDVVHFGGHTTIGDMATGLFYLDMEWEMTKSVLDNDETPFRVDLIPDGNSLAGVERKNEDALALIKSLPERNTHRLRFGDHVKLFTDGAFFSQLMQLNEPGYIDGHHGEWIMVPEQFEDAARAYWNEGYKIHVHCTGDLGLELALDVLEKLQWERPRFGHRYTIEHFGLSTPEQCRRLKELGGQVSANVYYLYELGAVYAREGLGHERASQMARLGSLARAGVPTALHSDYTMAPALPLNSAWVAANRINAEGEVMAEAEKLTLDQALRAITIDAAYILGRESEIGSLRAGKMADFAVLEADPYEWGAERLKDVPVWGTVFEGKPYKANRP